jgi:hypothetical protein
MAKERVPVNLADPKDIEAKMPEIKRLLAKASQELKALKAQVEMLTRIAGEAPVSAPAPPVNRKARKRQRPRKAAPSQERALRALAQAGRPMGPASLFRWMETEGWDGKPRNVAALNSILWAAEKAGRVGKTPNGLYVPPGFPTDRPLTDYDAAAANGMPVPAQAQLPGPNSSGSPTVVPQTSPDGGSRRGGEQEHGPGDGHPATSREFSGATAGG